MTQPDYAAIAREIAEMIAVPASPNLKHDLAESILRKHFEPLMEQSDLLQKRVKELEGENGKLRHPLQAIAVVTEEEYAELQQLRAERDELRRKLDKARDALLDLHDEQNGPPLVRREAQWTAAMEKAQAVLNELEQPPASP